MTNIGWFYEVGSGVAMDVMSAAAWYSKAACLGHAQGMMNLGLCHANGIGQARDSIKGIAWLCKALELGGAHAMGIVGRLYQH
jgi:TPR repeat protein